MGNHGVIRHGIAEIVKMAVVENKPLFDKLEEVDSEILVKSKFGTDLSLIEDIDSIDLKKLGADCDLLVGMAMESYVRAEFGNLWETHQCRPHAYGHTWSPGYELPGGMLHGHAVATCMGYGAYLAWKHCDWISQADCDRICKLINDLELSLWHDVMSDKSIFHASTKKMIQERGGNLAAPLPRGEIGKCGYLNDITDEQLSKYVDEYQSYVSSGNYARNGYGVEPHLSDVGLDHMADEATAFVRAEIALENEENTISNESNKEEKKDEEAVVSERNESYQEWIKKSQTDRNFDWKMNVNFEKVADIDEAPHFPHVTLFHKEVEKYATSLSSVASKNTQIAARVTMEENLFAPCMIGSLESQFLKIFAATSKAKNILDVGTFTGMSAIAFAEVLCWHLVMYIQLNQMKPQPMQRKRFLIHVRKKFEILSPYIMLMPSTGCAPVQKIARTLLILFSLMLTRTTTCAIMNLLWAIQDFVRF